MYIKKEYSEPKISFLMNFIDTIEFNHFLFKVKTGV